MGFVVFLNTLLVAFLVLKVLYGGPEKELEDIKDELDVVNDKLFKLEKTYDNLSIKSDDIYYDMIQRLENSRQYVLKLEKELKGKK